MLNWPRIRCALFGHGRMLRAKAPFGPLLYLCHRCGKILKIEFQEEPELEGAWQEWGKT